MIELDVVTIDMLYLVAYLFGAITFLLAVGLLSASALYALVYGAATILRRE